MRIENFFVRKLSPFGGGRGRISCVSLNSQLANAERCFSILNSFLIFCNMKKKLLFKLALVSLFVFVLASCTEGVTYIDNPTNKEITVTIDGKNPVKVKPNEFKKLDSPLKKGEHSMKVDDGNEIKFSMDDVKVILNPTLSTYIAVLQEYGVAIMSDKHDTTIILDDDEYYGPFPLVTSEPVIYTQDLNLLVDQPFKDEIYTSKTGTVTLKKIFRKNDFIKYCEEEYE